MSIAAPTYLIYFLLVAAAIAWQAYCERRHYTFHMQFGWFALSVYCAVIVGRCEAHRGTPAVFLGAVIGYVFGMFSNMVFVVFFSVLLSANYRWQERRLAGGDGEAAEAEAE